MSDLFDQSGADSTAPRPLADRLRPRALSEVIGQQQVLGPDAPLGVMLASGSLSSLILWGPPGVGKTTIARLLADETDLDFVQISAIFTGVADLKKVFEAAKQRRRAGMGTLLFVDEIHRFNKAQQDGFLPHMEDGTILLVGATTENPSFELNAALLSRATVFTDEVAQSVSIGEAQHAVAEGALKAEDIAQLGAVINGSHPGRQSAEEITLFDGTGVGLQDLAVAAAVVDLAVEKGVATEVDF